ncbi:hypothetical protein [Pedobacter nyackensis]|uniref:hypothetical protein n=1 Tax=Pedobacter nyackensis TaxID=475255 RepID=UPI00292DB3EC|nr:hypothetical protein [Pedobacter nyackensis]
MKYLVLPLCILVLLFSNCKTRNSDSGSSASSIKVKKNEVQWSETAAAASFNTKDSIISILGNEANETFTIRFKRPALKEKIEKLEAYSTLSPTRLSASISDKYQLDSTKTNKFEIRLIDNLKKRITGDFYLHLKRSKEYGGGVGETYIYQGRFDVLYEEISI